MPESLPGNREEIRPTTDPDSIELISQALINEGDAKSARLIRTIVTLAASVVLVAVTAAVIAFLFIGNPATQDKAWQALFLIIGGIGGFLFGKKLD